MFHVFPVSHCRFRIFFKKLDKFQDKNRKRQRVGPPLISEWLCGPSDFIWGERLTPSELSSPRAHIGKGGAHNFSESWSPYRGKVGNFSKPHGLYTGEEVRIFPSPRANGGGELLISSYSICHSHISSYSVGISSCCFILPIYFFVLNM